MKSMKKAISLLLVVLIVGSFCVNASAFNWNCPYCNGTEFGEFCTKCGVLELCADCGKCEECDKNNNTTYDEVTKDELGKHKVTVTVTKGSSYNVTIPKTIVLDGTTGEGTYAVAVAGDIDGDKQITVVPYKDEDTPLDKENKLALSQAGKNDIFATVEQKKTVWTYDDMDSTTGTIKATGLTAGSWSGSFLMHITYEEKVAVAGATFSGYYGDEPWIWVEEEPVTLTWAELQDGKDSMKYAYSADGISDARINSYTFDGCRSLTSIVIKSGITHIDPGAFAGCSNLTSVTIPNSVTHIAESTFSQCTSLTNITFNGTVVQWNNITLGDDWNSYVPAAQVVCTDGVVSLVEMITFQINNIEYQAESNMTWIDWINSDYNNGILTVDNDNHVISTNNGYYVLLDGLHTTYSTDFIGVGALNGYYLSESLVE